MKVDNRQGNTPKEENPFAALDAPIERTNDTPVAIGRVVTPGRYLNGNVPGERVSIQPANKGVWLAQQGVLRLEIASVKPSELEAAGGVDAWLKANPQKDKMTKDQRRKLVPIPGKIETEVAQPWEYVTAE